MKIVPDQEQDLSANWRLLRNRLVSKWRVAIITLIYSEQSTKKSRNVPRNSQIVAKRSPYNVQNIRQFQIFWQLRQISGSQNSRRNFKRF